MTNLIIALSAPIIVPIYSGSRVRITEWWHAGIYLFFLGLFAMAMAWVICDLKIKGGKFLYHSTYIVGIACLAWGMAVDGGVCAASFVMLFWIFNVVITSTVLFFRCFK